MLTGRNAVNTIRIHPPLAYGLTLHQRLVRRQVHRICWIRLLSRRLTAARFGILVSTIVVALRQFYDIEN